MILPLPKQIDIQSLGDRSIPEIRWGEDLIRSLPSAALQFLDQQRLPPGSGKKWTEWVVKFQPASPIAPIPNQGYELQWGEGEIILTAKNEQPGIFYGCISILQWATGPGNTVMLQQVRDFPSLESRGLMIDISRCKVPTMKSLKALIDEMAWLKMNQLQLYTEHTFAFKKHETVWKGASPLTREDIQELDAYCRARYIELVPNFNSFGHLERWLKHPAYQHLAEHPEPFTNQYGTYYPNGATLKPNQDSLDFLDELYAEMLPNFSSPQLNIGGDETWELGRGWSKPMADKIGKHQVYLNFLNQICDLARSHGKHPQFWGDILLEKPELTSSLSPETSCLVWGYEAEHPFEIQAGVFANLDRSFTLVPGTSSWRSLGGRFTNMKTNIESAVDVAVACKARGVLLTDWGDCGHHQPWTFSWIPLIWSACLSWNHHTDGFFHMENVFSFANQRIFNDSSNTVAQTLKALGEIPDTFSTKPHNASPIFQLCFGGQDQILTIRTQGSRNELLAAWERLGAATRNLACNDQLLLQEIQFIENLMKVGLLRGLKQPYQDAWEAAHAAYPNIWLARNRPGGLEESMGYLMAIQPDG